MPCRLVPLFALLLALSPVAAASTAVEGGSVTLVLQDQRGSDCSPAIGPTCQANITLNPTSPGQTSANVSQRIHYVGVAADTGSQPSDINKTARSGDLYVSDPIVPLVSATWMTHRPNMTSYTNDSLVMDENYDGFVYYGPALGDPTGPNDTHVIGWSYKGGSGPGVQYSEDQVGPFLVPNTPDGDTSHYYDQPGLLVCHDLIFADAPTCYAPFAPISGTGKNNTPDVWVGFSWDDVQASNNRSDLTMGFENSTPAQHDPSKNAPPSGPSPNSRAEHSNASQDKPTPTPVPPQDNPGSRSNGTSPMRVQHALTSPFHRLPPPPGPTLIVEIVGGGLLIGAILFALYTRFAHRRDILLRHPRRTALVEAIRSQPGLTISDLARRTSCSPMLASYHIDQLQRGGFVRKSKGKQRVRIYPAGVDHEELPPGFMPVMAAIIHNLRHAPKGLSRRALSGQLPDASDSTRRKAIRRLMAWGWIVEERVTKSGPWVLHLSGPPLTQAATLEESGSLSKEKTSRPRALLSS